LKKLIKINELDNVAVASADLRGGETHGGVTILEDIAFGHKLALRDIGRGGAVIKYGFPIGTARERIAAGSLVHTHNLATALTETDSYEYAPVPREKSKAEKSPTFMGYRRKDGSVGVRNEIWIIPLVGCVNKTAELLARRANERFGDLCGGVFAYTHPYGCSQLGGDHVTTQKILAGLAKHPNASGVLLLSLGCENNSLESFLPVLGEYDRDRVRTLVTQDCGDEISAGLGILEELARRASGESREEIPASELVIGMKCGGSDAFSGVTANPLCGLLAERFTGFGGRVILTETPEMFGAERLLMSRAASRDVFDKTVKMIDGFKRYFTAHGQPVYENPSPGNRAGGITTLEEKSLGCVQKGGGAQVTAVLELSEQCVTPGLNLLSGPGNDIVSCTNLTASGAHVILFTTGRGTPLGAPVPTVKIASHSALTRRKPGWIDFDAGVVLDGVGFDVCAAELERVVLSVAGGAPAKSEVHGYREIAIFKDGVTL